MTGTKAKIFEDKFRENQYRVFWDDEAERWEWQVWNKFVEKWAYHGYLHPAIAEKLCAEEKKL